MSAEDSSLRVGSYVRIDGLSSSPQHNGKYGFVTSQQGDRWSVVVAHHDLVLNARPVNLTVVEPEGRTAARSAVIFFPSPTASDEEILVAAGERSPLAGWPTSEIPADESRFLRNALGWKNPEAYAGVEREGAIKEDLSMYFDADSTSRIRNHHAEAIVSRLPFWEHQNVPFPAKGIRGACVLVHDPTKRIVHDVPTPAPSCAGEFTVDEAASVIAFHHSDDSKRQYYAAKWWGYISM
jgi:dipeptidyl aminopeptidase/acylaminoacyl peptidase